MSLTVWPTALGFGSNLMGPVLTIALAHLKGRPRQSLLSVLGIVLGVGFSVAMASMMEGSQQDFINRIVDYMPHVTLKDEFRTPPKQPVEQRYEGAAVSLGGVKPREALRGLKDPKLILEDLDNISGIDAAPTLRGQAFLGFGGKDISISAIGIDPQRERKVSVLEREMIAGSLNSLYGTANGIILGKGVAKKLGAVQGDTLTATSPDGVTLKMKVVGLFKTGIIAIDSGESYILLKKAQILQNRPNVVNQIRLRLEDIDTAREVATQVEAKYGYRAESWQEANAGILGIFVVDKAIMFSTVGAILVVASFGIYNIISTVTFEKTRDIAILKSLGFDETDIRRIFLLEGIALGVAGSVLGWVLGYCLCLVIDSIEFKIDMMIEWDGFTMIYSPTHYLIAGACALSAAIIAAILPARRAAKVNPVDIIRGAA